MKPRLFVTGASGRLGGRLALALASRFEVVAARHLSPAPSGLEGVPLDLGDAASVEHCLDGCRPSAVLHAAALADADACERQPEIAKRVNVDGTRHLADACSTRGLPLVALSTDLVVSSGDAPADEHAPTSGASTYATSKLAAERAILQTPTGAVLRVALVVGRGYGPRPTASEAVLWAVGRGERPRLFDDQFRTPIDAESVADLIGRVLARRRTGLLHAGGPERISRYALGLRVAKAFGIPSEALERVGREAQAGARRPADASLDSARALRELGWRPRPLDAALAESRPAPPPTSLEA